MKSIQRHIMDPKKVFAFGIIVLTLIRFDAMAQDVKLQSKVDKQNIVIGDQIQLEYLLQFDPTQFNVQLPRLADTFNRFEVVVRLKNDSVQKGEELLLRQKNILTHFDSGAYTIPPQTFTVKPLDGSPAYEISSEPLEILVNTVAVDTSKAIKPIYDIIAAQKAWWDPYLYYALALIGLLLVLALFFIIRKKMRAQKGPIKEIKKVFVSPWDNATQKIDSLVSKELWLNQHEKEHHTQLTDIIRTYIEDGFGIDCFEKTSQEIITSVKKHLQKNKYKNRSQELEKLRTIFFTADLVKFAKSKPSEQEHELSNQAATQFVESTQEFLIQKQQAEKAASN